MNVNQNTSSLFINKKRKSTDFKFELYLSIGNKKQDLLSTVKAKYAKSDKKFKHKNLELTEEYRRVTEQYRDLQNKFKHFVVGNNSLVIHQERDKKKYQEIKEMNKERIHQLIQKLLEVNL